MFRVRRVLGIGSSKELLLKQHAGCESKGDGRGGGERERRFCIQRDHRVQIRMAAQAFPTSAAGSDVTVGYASIAST